MKKIGTRMLCTILPVIIIAMALTTWLSATSSKKLIAQEIEDQMQAVIDAELGGIENTLNEVATSTEGLAGMIAYSYSVTPLTQMEKILSGVVASNEAVLGSGIWFESKVYDPTL